MLMTLAMPAELQAEEDTRPAAPVRIKVRSADELRTAVRHSRLQALTLDGTAMTHILRFDAKRGVLEVQAAATWAELAKYLAGRKLNIDAFAATPGLPAIVGEAVSGAAPGPDGLPVSAHVIGLTLVTPDGELRRADRDTNAELLRAALGGQGVIGLLYSVTFAVASLSASAADAAAPVALDIPQSKPTHAAEYAFETLVPPAALEAYLADVRALAEERRLTLLGLSVRRYRKDASACLAWATQEWAGVRVRFGVRTTIGASVAATEVRRALITLALARGGAFLPRDLRYATREQINACYPSLATLLRDKRRADPAGRLQNDWYREVLAKLRGERCDSRWTRSEADGALSGART